ncbi:MAG TPA: citrate synthase [Micromonosporaceae bacterium]|nr:citrate synthase [Micromonosporaceae bacterium]
MADVSLETPGGHVTLSNVPAVEGASGLDIGKLMAGTGHVTYDPGFVNTANCQSEITYIDGDAGILRYRGYPIDQLAEGSSFVEVCHLLMYGELPTHEQIAEFGDRLRIHTLLHEDMRRFFEFFPRDAHPMAVLSAAVSALGTFYQDSLNPFDAEQVEISTVRLLAKLPTIASYAYKKSIGQPMLYPDNSLGYVENFLRMTFGVPATTYEVDPVMAKALDLLFILHADHEQNCSTASVRLVGSAHASLFASVSAGVNALSGPLHGGANEQVLEMLAGIRAEGGDVKRFVERVKARERGVRLMGFGHRVYKNYDPRAAIVKRTVTEVLERMHKPDPLLDIAMELEEIALADEYFVSRKLYPNVDFYTGLIYKAMGFPTKMFTVLFAIGRLPGWIAQWREMINDPATKIGRPRQVYTGHSERDFIPIDKR